ncbi:hypothetical protein [Nocardia callitridis]|uniref:Uncharacterized protein n=1 Tax=Nocardia callitridis TaxID=648753 RepID=A0ABP9KNW1_9NOCA
MHHTTARGALRGATLSLAFCAVVAGGAAAAGAAPLRLEPATDNSSQVAEEYTSTGSSTISATVNAKIACLLFNGNFLC